MAHEEAADCPQVPRYENCLMTKPWTLDELAHMGPEHLDPDFVAGYDRKQGYPDPTEDLAVLAAHGLDETSVVVDLGAGTGRFALAAARRFGHLTAVDISPAMLAVFGRWLGRWPEVLSVTGPAAAGGPAAMPRCGMPVPKDVYDFLVDSHPGLADLALWVREIVLASEPDLTERVYLGWDGIGFRHPDAGYVCAIYPRDQEQEVRLLFEHGVRLDDPEGLLEGAGTQTRFIRIREEDELLAVAIGRYVHDGVAERLFRR
jgi:SAM-dependent methyltransferase